MKNNQLFLLILLVIIAGVTIFFLVKNSGSDDSGKGGMLLGDSPSEQRAMNISSGGSTKYPMPVMNKVFDGCKDHHGKKINWEKSQKILRRDKGQLNNNYFVKDIWLNPGLHVVKDYKCPAPNGKMVTGTGNLSFVRDSYDYRREAGNPGGFGDEIGTVPESYVTNGFNYMKCKDRKVKLGLTAENYPEETDINKIKFHWTYMCQDGEIDE